LLALGQDDGPCRRITRASRQTVSAKIRRARGCGIGNHGERGLQRVSEIARVTSRLLGLRLAMFEQLIDFVGQRPISVGNSLLIRVLLPERMAATSSRTRRNGHSP
jgi:hypothetical protein